VVYQPSVCQVVASINEFVGGPALSVTSLNTALTKQQISSRIFTLNYQKIGKQIIDDNIQVHSYDANFLARCLRGFHIQAGYDLNKLALNELDLIHNHGLWMFPNVYARQAALSHGLPLVISPHGMLEAWSLKHSRTKKWLAWLLYEQKNLNNATVFHATSREEVNSIRQLGFQQPIVLIPNGIDVPKDNYQPNKEVLTKLFPALTDKRWLLFFSRLHPKKGIDNLLYVWQELAVKYSDWHLVIAGPNLINYQEKLELLVKKMNLVENVTFTGMLSGEYKACALSNADLFVLPTHSENFGIAIAESLAYRVPVITTKGAPWQELETYKCGWWVEDNQEALMDALVEAMEMPANKRQEMGLKGRKLVEVKYSWQSIAKDMASVYHWILTGSEPPACVQFYGS
jgi:glycosyltransferase involved in cell wall biosynthesis